jgi:lysophospholipid acyltransferase 1/2
MLSQALWYRFVYFYLSANSRRLYYYTAWTLSDAVHNASGFGFNGLDESGKPKWDLLNNVNIFALETATNIKGIIDNWHIQTSQWLRVIAFERLPSGKTLGVFVLSAFWHGFYPGYYITFLMGACLVYIGRGVSILSLFVYLLVVNKILSSFLIIYRFDET